MSIFDIIKNNVSILDVVRDYSTLKKAGSYWKGQCPFHNEKTASFTVSPHKEIFYCFGCHVSGDVISFIARVEQCSQKEAAEHLAERFGVELPKQAFQQSSSNAQEKKHYYAVCDLVADWCHQQLLKHKIAYTYLLERGFTHESIKQFSLGYFPSGLKATKQLLDYAKKHNILCKDLVEAFILKESRTVVHSSFEDRILFPIKDHLGRCCGFGGRIFKPQDSRPKYYNSHENEFFVKGSLLFGLDVAKKSIQDSEKVCIVEGYTDCVAMVQHGFTNTVATLGTSCTAQHLKQLSRYADTVYVVYDGDKAGYQAVLRLTKLCWHVDMELKVVMLPAGTDPSSFLQAGNDMAQLMHGAQNIFLFFIESISAQFQQLSLAKKLKEVRSLLDALASLSDQLKRDLLLQEASRTLGIPFVVLKEELERTLQEKAVEEEKKPKAEETAVKGYPKATLLEKKLVCAILNNTDLLTDEHIYYLKTYLPRPLCTIVDLLATVKNSGSSQCFRDFFATLNQSQQQYISKMLLSNELQDHESFEYLFTSWQQKQWKRVVTGLTERLAVARKEGNSDKEREILAQFTRLKKAMMAGVLQQSVDV